jgi:hypothetical protein
VATPRTSATITAPDIAETSGIAVSVVNPDVYWVHNDSGDTARTFAVDKDGNHLATLAFDTAKPTDIEDMAIEDVSPTQSRLYFADIGDNKLARKDVVIHRIDEPKLSPARGALQDLTVQSETMRVVYEDAAPHNAETLLFDSLTKELFIATKKSGGPSEVHRVGPFKAGSRVTTTKVASVDIDFATGGDLSRDGHMIVIRNKTDQAWLWLRDPKETVGAALARPACRIPIAKELQGEAFAFFPKSDGYVTVSEGASPDLHVSLFQP